MSFSYMQGKNLGLVLSLQLRKVSFFVLRPSVEVLEDYSLFYGQGLLQVMLQRSCSVGVWGQLHAEQAPETLLYYAATSAIHSHTSVMFSVCMLVIQIAPSSSRFPFPASPKDTLCLPGTAHDPPILLSWKPLI